MWPRWDRPAGVAGGIAKCNFLADCKGGPAVEGIYCSALAPYGGSLLTSSVARSGCRDEIEKSDPLAYPSRAGHPDLFRRGGTFEVRLKIGLVSATVKGPDLRSLRHFMEVNVILRHGRTHPLTPIRRVGIFRGGFEMTAPRRHIRNHP